ncbi:sensor histidine kinase [Paenibacillus sp. GCM10027626]|uniref:sensor histidine kinase n=1 Tax=Paenibacillus sp. GCM10027626 TaxID=3273411 RepID=UPI0036328CB7
MRLKLIMLFIVFLLLPALIFSKIWFDRTTETIKETTRQFNEQLVRQLNYQLNDYFKDLERSTLPLIAHPLIKQFMLLHEDDSYERFLISRNIESDLLRPAVFGRPDIFSMTIYSSNGIHVSNQGASLSNDDVQSYMKNTDNDNFNVMGIRWVNGNPILTVTRKFKDTTTYRTSGLLVINLRLNEIWNIVSQIQLSSKGSLWIIDQNDRVLYNSHNNLEKLGTIVPNWFKIGQRAGSTNNFFIHEENEVSEIVNYNISDATGWTIISEFPFAELNKDLIKLRDYSIWTFVVITLVAVFIIGGYTIYITNSLNVLERLMRQAQNGNFHVRAPVKRERGLNNLFVGFNNMISELKRLVVEVHASQLREKDLVLQQKESSLRALQFQINPHFLYNTLEMINSHALLQEIRPISRMATALADMFRYCMKDTMNVIEFEEELTYILTYLEIQKERFPQMECKIRCEKEISNQILIARLSLQPLIENCFLHGYEDHMLMPTFIGITGEYQEGDFIITVSDHGKGMPQERKDKFNTIFTHTDAKGINNDNYNNGVDGHIGLINVHARIRLLFGYPYGLSIVKSDENGTDVQLKVPASSTAAGGRS